MLRFRENPAKPNLKEEPYKTRHSVRNCKANIVRYSAKKWKAGSSRLLLNVMVQSDNMKRRKPIKTYGLLRIAPNLPRL